MKIDFDKIYSKEEFYDTFSECIWCNKNLSSYGNTLDNLVIWNDCDNCNLSIDAFRTNVDNQYKIDTVRAGYRSSKDFVSIRKHGTFIVNKEYKETLMCSGDISLDKLFDIYAKIDKLLLLV